MEQPHQKPSSELLRKDKNPGSGLRVGISKALWKCDSTGAGSWKRVPDADNTGLCWETLSHGAYVYMAFLLKSILAIIELFPSSKQNIVLFTTVSLQRIPWVEYGIKLKHYSGTLHFPIPEPGAWALLSLQGQWRPRPQVPFGEGDQEIIWLN